MNIEDDDNLDLDKLLKIEKKPETLEERVKKDIEFINNEIMCENNQGLLCKYNKSIKAVTIYGKEKQDYIDFWEKQYSKTPKEMNEIINVCKNKLSNNLISVDEMINLVRNSKDTHNEKIKILQFLKS